MTDLHDKWPHRWLSPKAVARPSGVAGTGVFATGKISKGAPVGVLGGVIVPRSEIKKYRKIMTQVGIQIDEEFFIVPTTRQELEVKGVFNHSCDPNIGFSNSITFIAMRDIEAGEELVFDYAFCEKDFDTFVCNCGAETCRGEITADDWQNKDIQDKYKDYFSPYLRDKLR